MLPSIELMLVPSVNKQLYMGCQGLQTARKTTGATHQAGQVVTKLGVSSLDTVGLGLIRTHFVACLGVMQFEIDMILVAEILLGRRFRDHVLRDPLVTGGNHTPTQETAAGPVHKCNRTHPGNSR